MSKYQVLYKYNTKSFVDIFEAPNVDSVLSFFDDISATEIVEVREFVFELSQYKEDDGNYIHSSSIKISSDNFFYSFKIPKLKKTVNDTELSNYIKQYLKSKNESIKTIKITTNYK